MRPRKSAPLSALGGLLAAYLCIPLIASVPRIVTSDWGSVDWGALGSAAATSAASATLAAGLIALGGIPLGYWLSRRRSRFASVVGFAVQLPLALPPLTSGILLLILIGPYSAVGRIFSGGLTDSFAGIVIASVFVASPFLVIAARSAFNSVDPILEDVGATLGHGHYARFFQISLPLAWPAIRAGLLLSWLRAFGEFGATVMVAYHPYSLPVYTYVAFGSQGLPAMMPIILPTLVLALLATLILAGTSRKAWARAQADAAAPLLLSEDTELQAMQASMHRADSVVNHGGNNDASHHDAAVLSFAFHKTVGTFVLDVTWTTPAKRLAILGTSGSGKSMTLRLMAGLEAADAASMTIANTNYVPKSAEERHIAYVPQDYGLFPHLTVAQQWTFARDANAQAAHHWSRHLGLGELEYRYPNTLSLGQRQRVSIVRALSRPCPLILLDEPFSALDTPRRRQLRESLRTLQSEISATTIVVTHDPDEAALLADEVLIIDQGKVLQSGPTLAVFRQPASLRVAELLGLTQIGEGRLMPSGLLDIGIDHIDGTPIVLKTLSERVTPIGPARASLENLKAIDKPAGVENLKDDASAGLPGNTVLWRIDPSAVRIAEYPTVHRITGYRAVVMGHRLMDGFGHMAVLLGTTTLLIRETQSRARLPVGATTYIDIDPAGIDIWPSA